MRASEMPIPLNRLIGIPNQTMAKAMLATRLPQLIKPCVTASTYIARWNSNQCVRQPATRGQVTRIKEDKR